jgi:hypothetical protein
MISAVLMGAVVMAAVVALVMILKEMLFPSGDRPTPTCCRCGKKIEAPDECMFLLPGYKRACYECLDDMR